MIGHRVACDNSGCLKVCNRNLVWMCVVGRRNVHVAGWLVSYDQHEAGHKYTGQREHDQSVHGIA